MCGNRTIALLLIGFCFAPLTSIAGPKDAPASLQSPARIALRPGRKLLVSDYRLRAVFTLRAKDLSVQHSFPVNGRPLGIAWAKKRIYVGNETLHRVQVFNKRGKWQYDLGKAEAYVAQPNDIAIDIKNGLVFVVDSGEKLIKTYLLRGAPVGTFPASDSGLLAGPVGIALDRKRGEVIVSDHGDPAAGIPARLQVFSYTGEHLREISGKVGGGMLGSTYQFSRPQGMAVDRQGHLFVVASWLGRVLVFDRDTGEQVSSLGGYGTDPGQLSLPLDVAIQARTKDVFVTNNRLGRVEVFRAGGALP